MEKVRSGLVGSWTFGHLDYLKGILEAGIQNTNQPGTD
jgi:hypothetical protein